VNPHLERAFNYYYEACNYGLPQAYTHVGNMYKQVNRH
jgi:TPR repeat protein